MQVGINFFSSLFLLFFCTPFKDRNPTTGDLTNERSYNVGIVYAKNPTGKLQGLNDLVVSPDGKFVYGTNSGYGGTPFDSSTKHSMGKFIVWWSRDLDTGDLSGKVLYYDYPENCEDVSALDGVTSVAISPDGKHLYVVANRGTSATRSQTNGGHCSASMKVDCGIAYWERNAATGGLSNLVKVSDCENLGALNSVVVSPDGLSVVATTRVPADTEVSDENINQSKCFS